jgi:hypothetical protein
MQDSDLGLTKRVGQVFEMLGDCVEGSYEIIADNLGALVKFLLDVATGQSSSGCDGLANTPCACYFAYAQTLLDAPCR